MDFKQLQTFLAIAECGSATKAAQMLHIVQPAISRQMRILEDELGTSLFYRERNGMELTDAGRILLEHAKRVMRELDEARAQLQPSSSVVSGHVRLGMPASTCDLLAGELVATVKQRHPQIRMAMLSGFGGFLEKSLLNGELELAIVNDPEASPLLETRYVINEQLFLIGPAGSGLRPDQPLPLSALRGKPMVLPVAPHAMRTNIERACALANVQLDVVAEVNSMHMQRSLVRYGVGWTVMPSASFFEDLKQGALTGAPLESDMLQRHLALCLPVTRQTSAATRCVAEILLELTRKAVQGGGWHSAGWVA
ncbi:MAG: LysR substrate-binding domain-containing protein [Betaproteobacteria bacterium]